MSLFGKIMLFVNLLAAGGFVYLATQDWKGRQTIAAGGLRHQIVLSGLPLGGVKGVKGETDDPDTMPAAADAEVPFRFEGVGGVPVRTVSKKLLESYFQNAGTTSSDPNSLAVSTAVPNQIAEVVRVKAKIEEVLGRAGSSAERVALLKGWLLNQIETFPERVQVLALAAAEREDPDNVNRMRPKNEDELQKDTEELQRKLMARIEGVLNPPTSLDPAATTPLKDEDLADAGTDEQKIKIAEARLAKVAEARAGALGEDDRRRKLAHLLVHLSTESAWQKRVLAVIGVRTYIRAVQVQTRRFSEMAEQATQLLSADQDGFVAQLMGRPFDPQQAETPEIRGLRREAEEKTLLANRMAELRAKWVEQETKDRDLVSQRRTQLKELTDQLNKVKGQVDVMLSRQSTIEAGLFEVQREVAITLDEVYRFEAELAQRERKLLGGGK
jgi:hypothetical protein